LADNGITEYEYSQYRYCRPDQKLSIFDQWRNQISVSIGKHMLAKTLLLQCLLRVRSRHHTAKNLDDFFRPEAAAH
jgi:hypothetical protein